jgi:hypothetical protein
VGGEPECARFKVDLRLVMYDRLQMYVLVGAGIENPDVTIFKRLCLLSRMNDSDCIE